MVEDQSSYKRVFKSTSFLGGVQIISVLINMIRAKAIAVILGPEGFGLLNLFTSSINIVVNSCSFGMNVSSIRNFSQAIEMGDKEYLFKVYHTFFRWLLFSAFLGAFFLIVFSYPLSFYTFGNTDYSISYIFLSVYIFFTTINNGFIAYFQGIRQLKKLALVSLVGLFFGVLASLPAYYFLKEQGIIVGLILSAFITFVVGYYVKRKTGSYKANISFLESFTMGFAMAKLGLMLVLSSILGSITVYLINAFISYHGSIGDVGLYQAGISMSNQYVSLILGAMASDYFPRLAAVHSDNVKVKNLANQQAEISILIAGPMIIALILFLPLLIDILFTAKFYSILTFTRWIAIGLIFKVASFSLGYISFAKGDKKVFLWMEGVFGNVIVLIFNTIAYYYYGLNGLGISFLGIYFTYFVVVTIVCFKLYRFRFTIDFYKILVSFVILVFSAFAITQFFSGLIVYFCGGVIMIFGIIYSVRKLNSRMQVLEIIKSYLKKKVN